MIEDLIVTPAELAESLEQKNFVDGEDIGTVEEGDVIDLVNFNIIRNGVVPSEAPFEADLEEAVTAVIVDDDGNVNYEDIEFRLKSGQIKYIGAETLTESKIYYSYCESFSNDLLVDKIYAAQKRFEEDLFTTTVFGQLLEVEGEVYDGSRNKRELYILDKAPVREIKSVKITRERFTEKIYNDEGKWRELKDSEYSVYAERGLELNVDYYPKAVKIDYKYGFEEVPVEVKEVIMIYAMWVLQRSHLANAGIKGLDNFDPQTMGAVEPLIQNVKEEYVIHKHDIGPVLLKEGKVFDEEGNIIIIT